MVLPLLLPVLASLLPRPVFPAAKHPAPAFSVHPQKVEYLLGDTVGLTCSAPPARDQVSVFQYYSNMGWAVSARVSSGWKHTYNLNITEPRNAGSYSCNYYTGKSGRFIQSYESNHISISVKDPPPEPTLSVDPPSGVVSEGHPLLITCTAPGNATQLRFHFYQDGAEIVPGDVGSEISTMEPRTSSMTVSELSIPQVDTNSTGEYTCRYEEKESGRWIMSTKSHAVTVTLKGEAALENKIHPYIQSPLPTAWIHTHTHSHTKRATNNSVRQQSIQLSNTTTQHGRPFPNSRPLLPPVPIVQYSRPFPTPTLCCT
nr:osteoclast-associated immunoglobulin-like receptor [Chrysemys picta bellii]